MSLSRHKFDEIVTLLRMRGTAVGTQRAEAVFRELERIAEPTFADIFDRLRSNGASITFSAEIGVIRTCRENDRLRAERNARQMAEIRRRTAEFEADNGPRIYRGEALRRLIARDVDRRGTMRGPAIPGWVL